MARASAMHKMKQWAGVGPQYHLVVVQPDGAALDAVADLMREGLLKARVDRVFPLSEAAAASRYVEEGHTAGKVVLDCRGGGGLSTAEAGAGQEGAQQDSASYAEL